MPPKKAKGKKGKKKKKKNDAELELEDKYKKTMDEIEALKDHLAVRKQYARRAQSATVDYRERMQHIEEELDIQKADQKMVNADMTRQYKTMQTEMGLRIHHLESELTRTRQRLAQTEADLKTTTEDRDRIQKDKDEQVTALNLRISQMERSYEGVLHDALNSLLEKLDLAMVNWEQSSNKIQSKNKQVLLEFGLNPLDI
ncbi:coiled-coil domain-containing protein 153-like [Liolophura sinensis]|uniref:coiled-coil domain-containing protein 153-like n=1 Tax=Liolophura sinensis TaxID=3198878 RepID=UPI0031594B42